MFRRAGNLSLRILIENNDSVLLTNLYKNISKYVRKYMIENVSQNLSPLKRKHTF